MRHRMFQFVVRNRSVLFILCFALTAVGSIGAQTNTVTSLTSRDGKMLVIPVKDIGAQAGFFSFGAAPNVTMRFFAVLDKNKTVRIAFDACDVCYRAKKGYRIVDGLAVCGNCGNRFPLEALGEDSGGGGCWPSYLAFTTGTGNVILKVSDLNKKQYLFP
jgi:uncharacterized membrane protein